MDFKQSDTLPTTWAWKYWLGLLTAARQELLEPSFSNRVTEQQDWSCASMAVNRLLEYR
jgi:hypothetical protein